MTAHGFCHGRIHGVAATGEQEHGAGGEENKECFHDAMVRPRIANKQPHFFRRWSECVSACSVRRTVRLPYRSVLSVIGYALEEHEFFQAQSDCIQNGLVLPKDPKNLELLLRDVDAKGFLDIELVWKL